MKLQKASRKRAKLRIGLFGASGSGKTMSALKLAHGLTGDWDKIAIIDTERESASLYAHLGDYNTLPLNPPYEPECYMDAIHTCERAGVEVIIIDSISHEWTGKGGCLELVEKVNARNDYAKWKDITPRHNAFIDRILQSSCHVICCGRSKDDVEMVKNDKGKLEPQKVGLKAITRDGFDYEMTVCFDIDKWHQAACSKDRTQLFDGKPAFVIDQATGQKLIDWMNQAPDEVAQQEPPEPKTDLPEPEPTDAKTNLRYELDKERIAQGLEWPQVFEKTGVTLTKESTVGELQEVLGKLINASEPAPVG